MVARSQNSADISYFATDLEKIRAKPAMYIGLTDGDDIFNLWREALDNGTDEARAGRNSYVGAWYDGTYFWVLDQGEGIPVTKHAKAKISTLTHVLTNLQSSGKMQKGAYDDAIGTHGAGQKCIVALSESFDIWTFRSKEGGWWSTAFVEGKEVKKPYKSKPPKFNGKTPKKGTLIKFKPSAKIFGKSKINFERVLQWAELTAYMNPKLTIEVINEKGKVNTFYSKAGISELVENQVKACGAEKISEKVFSINSKTIELAVAFTNHEEQIKAYTNTVYNVDGGVHLDAFHKAYFDVLKTYMNSKDNFTPSNSWDGLIGVINYKINAPQFSSQTKDKLVDIRVKQAAYDEIKVGLQAFFNKNKGLAKELCAKASAVQKLTESFKASKKLIADVKKAGRGQSAKLADVIGNAPAAKRELFLVEGDSAAGGAKRARDKLLQAVFPLKGKPLNVMEASADKINGNAEVVGILAAMGADLSKDTVTIRYGKIIIMADADVDGFHIATLLLGLFWKFAPSLYKQGMIYILNGPRYKVTMKDAVYFGNNKVTLRKKYGENATITYLKGWGEVDEWHLKPLCFDPKTRSMTQINYPRSKKEIQNFEALLGKDSNYRKKLLNILRESGEKQ